MFAIDNGASVRVGALTSSPAASQAPAQPQATGGFHLPRGVVPLALALGAVAGFALLQRAGETRLAQAALVGGLGASLLTAVAGVGGAPNMDPLIGTVTGHKARSVYDGAYTYETTCDTKAKSDNGTPYDSNDDITITYQTPCTKTAGSWHDEPGDIVTTNLVVNLETGNYLTGRPWNSKMGIESFRSAVRYLATTGSQHYQYGNQVAVIRRHSASASNPRVDVLEARTSGLYSIDSANITDPQVLAIVNGSKDDPVLVWSSSTLTDEERASITEAGIRRP